MRKRTSGLLALCVGLGLLGLAAPTAVAAPGDEIVVVDQGVHRGTSGQKVRILQQNANWTSPSAQTWFWPVPDEYRWHNITDVKLRVYRGKKVVVVSAGGGRVAIVDKELAAKNPKNPKKAVLWTAFVPVEANAHSVELLPGGQVVVAGSWSGRVYFFAAGFHQPKVVAGRLPGAHGVLYNDNRLWALGTKALRQYDIHSGGLTAAGTEIPVPSSGGHDLAPAYGSPSHEMWFSTTRSVYRFDKYVYPRDPKKAFTKAPGAATGFRAKSVGNQRDGTIVQTRPEEVRDARCADFATPAVQLYDTTGKKLLAKLRKGSCFYKARPVVWGYY